MDGGGVHYKWEYVTLQQHNITDHQEVTTYETDGIEQPSTIRMVLAPAPWRLVIECDIILIEHVFF